MGYGLVTAFIGILQLTTTSNNKILRATQFTIH
jgi:hypothetical protein